MTDQAPLTDEELAGLQGFRSRGGYLPDFWHGKRTVDILIAEVERLREQVSRLREDQSLMQDDLRALLRAAGMGDHARPQSPHEVMLQAVAEVERLRAALHAHRLDFAAPRPEHEAL